MSLVQVMAWCHQATKPLIKSLGISTLWHNRGYNIPLVNTDLSVTARHMLQYYLSNLHLFKSVMKILIPFSLIYLFVQRNPGGHFVSIMSDWRTIFEITDGLKKLQSIHACIYPHCACCCASDEYQSTHRHSDGYIRFSSIYTGGGY